MKKNDKDKKIIIYSANTSDINNKFIKNFKNTKNNYDDDTMLIVTEGKSDAEYLKKILSKNLKKYMDKKGKNVTDLSNDINISYATVNDWCNGKKYPRVDKIQLLANYFDVEKSDLIEERPKNKIPVLGRIPAGIPIEAIEEILDYEEIPKDWLTGDKDYFALKIDGHSMEPFYNTRRYCYI